MINQFGLLTTHFDKISKHILLVAHPFSILKICVTSNIEPLWNHPHYSASCTLLFLPEIFSNPLRRQETNIRKEPLGPKDTECMDVFLHIVPNEGRNNSVEKNGAGLIFPGDFLLESLVRVAGIGNNPEQKITNNGLQFLRPRNCRGRLLSFRPSFWELFLPSFPF